GFDDATFERSAAAFDNPDHVSIVIHNYRWRLGLAEGEPHYDELEQRLAKAPTITVPTITLEGDANGAPHPEASAYAGKFAGRYSRGSDCRRGPAHHRDGLAREGDRRRCFAGRAAGDDAETRALLGHRLRLPEVGGAAQCPAAVHDRDRWARHAFHSRSFAT